MVIGLKRVLDLVELAEEEPEQQVPLPTQAPTREVPPPEEPHKTSKALKVARSYSLAMKKEVTT